LVFSRRTFGTPDEIDAICLTYSARSSDTVFVDGLVVTASIALTIDAADAKDRLAWRYDWTDVTSMPIPTVRSLGYKNL
jgi:hypothetical protein